MLTISVISVECFTSDRETTSLSTFNFNLGYRTMLKTTTDSSSIVLIEGYNLPDHVQAELDDYELESSFFLFENVFYELESFLKVDPVTQEVFAKDGWIGYTVDTALSGLMFKFDENDSDRVIVGRWTDI